MNTIGCSCSGVVFVECLDDVLVGSDCVWVSCLLFEVFELYDVLEFDLHVESVACACEFFVA